MKNYHLSHGDCKACTVKSVIGGGILFIFAVVFLHAPLHLDRYNYYKLYCLVLWASALHFIFF